MHNREIEVLVDYVVNEKLKNRIAVFYEASLWGDSIIKDLKQALKKHNLELVGQAAHAEESVDHHEAIYKLKKFNPNAIFCLAQPNISINFVRCSVNHGLSKTIFLGTSNLQLIQLLLKNSRGIDMIISSSMPDPSSDKFAITQKFKKAIERHFPKESPSTYLFKGYLMMTLLSEALDTVAGKITLPKITTCLKKITEIKGMRIHYDEKTDSLVSPTIWINSGFGKEWQEYSTLEE